jgi:uncharacterized protein (DUF2267 family)
MRKDADMHTTGLEAIETTLSKTHMWLHEIMHELGWTDSHHAYLALKGVLHSLRDHLPVEEAVQLGAQLPMLVRGLYYEGWRPAGKPLHERHREDFLMDAMSGFGDSMLAKIFAGSACDADQIVHAVFNVLARHTTAAPSVRHVLPAEIRALWPLPAPEARA